MKPTVYKGSLVLRPQSCHGRVVMALDPGLVLPSKGGGRRFKSCWQPFLDFQHYSKSNPSPTLYRLSFTGDGSQALISSYTGTAFDKGGMSGTGVLTAKYWDKLQLIISRERLDGSRLSNLNHDNQPHFTQNHSHLLST